jgi:hypothetical protein
MDWIDLNWIIPCQFHIVHLDYAFICFLMLISCTVVFVLGCNWPYLAVVKHANKWTELNYYYYLCCYGLRLSLWNWASNRTIAYPLNDTRFNMGQQWNDADRRNQRTRRETCPSATLSTINPTWAALGANPDLQGEKPKTNHLSHGSAYRLSSLGVLRLSLV